MNIDTQIKDFIRDYAQYKEALKEEARMTTKAHGHVRQAEIIMEKLGHEKYSLSGMCSAAMRHDLEQEVSKLLRELDDMTKQRDALAEDLREMLKFTPRSLSCKDFHHPAKDYHSESDDCQPAKRFHEALEKAEQALEDTKGGSHARD